MKIVLKLFTTFVLVVAAILASPKHRDLPGAVVSLFIEFTATGIYCIMFGY